MKPVLKIALLATFLAVSGAAMAQDTGSAPPAGKDYPFCSKTITDECLNPSQGPHAMKHKAAMHKVRHAKKHMHTKRIAHVAVKKATVPATPVHN